MTMNRKAREMFEDMRNTLDALVKEFESEAPPELVDLSRCDNDPCGEYARSLRTEDGWVVEGVFRRHTETAYPYYVVIRQHDGDLFIGDYTAAGRYDIDDPSYMDLVVATT